MKNEVSIGELSKMYNIPITTLRYYEQIGLFMPSRVNQTSGYRYYSTEQFMLLNTISYLKNLGVSLKTIKQQLEAVDENNLLQLFRDEQKAIIEKIQQMNLIKERYDKRIQELEEALQVKEVGQVFIKKVPTRTVMCIKEKITDRSELELVLKDLQNKSFEKSSIFIGMAGVTINKSALENGDFREYNAIFILPEESINHSPFVKVIEESEYACIYYREDFGKSKRYYHKLMDYIKKNNYNIIGSSLERPIVDNFVTKNLSKHLSEIQIPIGKINS